MTSANGRNPEGGAVAAPLAAAPGARAAADTPDAAGDTALAAAACGGPDTPDPTLAQPAKAPASPPASTTINPIDRGRWVVDRRRQGKGWVMVSAAKE
jgi:hypothetical protein